MRMEGDEEVVRQADYEFGIGAGLGSFADMDAALGGRTVCDGDDGSTGEGAQGDEYYIEADGVLDWEVQNEMIFLTKKWNKGILRGSPRELHDLRERIKAAWKRKVGDDIDIYGMMPWDGVDWDQVRKQCFPPGATPFQPESSSGPRPNIDSDQLRKLAARPEDDFDWDKLRDPKSSSDPEAESYPPGETPLLPVSSSGPSHNHNLSQNPPRGNSNPLLTLEQIEMAPCPLTTYPGGEESKKACQHFSELWHIEKADCCSPEDFRGLKALMETTWELFVGPKGTDDSMPWHTNFVSPHPTTSSSQPLKDPSPDSSSSPSDRRYESQKLAFTEEWEIMAHDKDATKRYALARLIQAAFATVVGPRSEEEDMPWTTDLRRSKHAPRDSAGREQSQSESQSQSKLDSSPHPGTNLETDYTLLRAEYAVIFLNRVNGEEREEVERVAGVFREAWVREVGVRAHDVRMPWDEVLAQQRDGVVEEGVEREVVSGEGVESRARGRDREGELSKSPPGHLGPGASRTPSPDGLNRQCKLPLPPSCAGQPELPQHAASAPAPRRRNGYSA
ncbi:hypothetical protein V500_05619 [Pseudogymnoascus sp. VKM F-4518 (FW-2643)]|nr:hypothetical protein V500_05619 [Pseudogymnoascus sp. VKM F-4518 (FW-2643)]